MLLSDYIAEVRQLVHDVQSTDWSDADLTTLVNGARKRVALDTHCVRYLFTGLNLITQQEVYPMYGGVGGLVITNPGSGYVNPVVAIGAPPAGGVQATATAVATGGVITSLQMTNWGSGYTSVPTVNITGAPGINAAATATTLRKVIDVLSIFVLWPGNAQGMTLRWYPFTTFQAWFRANRLQFGYPNIWTDLFEMNRVYFARPPDQPYGAEWDTVVLTDDLVLVTDNDTQIIPPWDDAVKYYASHLALLKLQNFEHADYYNKKYEARVKQLLATKQDRRISNIYQNTYRRLMRGA